MVMGAQRADAVDDALHGLLQRGHPLWKHGVHLAAYTGPCALAPRSEAVDSTRVALVGLSAS